VVLDSGDGVTHCVPIYEGFAIESAIQRIDVAGRDVTRYLNLLLRKEGHIFHRTSEFEIVRDIKESVCQVAPYNFKDENREQKSYTMPDGSSIKIGAAHYQAPEVLFRPELIGLEYNGIPQCISNAIQQSDYELRKQLYTNIYFSGGTTLFEGFGERILHEIRKLTPPETKIRINAPPERLGLTWTGGSILATLETFRKIMRTKAQYDEEVKGGPMTAARRY